MSWEYTHLSRTASQHHGAKGPAGQREIWHISITRPALVLGSSQPGETVKKPLPKNVEWVRRKSGGGAVYLAPGEILWLDVIVPNKDPLHTADVHKSSLWLGRLWAEVLQSFGLKAEPYEDKFEPGEYGRLICFASKGPGEVLLGTKKCLGIAQRRTRMGTWFQCALLLRWEPGDLLECLNPELPYIDVNLLEASAQAVDLDSDQVLESFLGKISKL